MPLASSNTTTSTSNNGGMAKNQLCNVNGQQQQAQPQQQYTEYTTTNIPAFLSKLWTLVEDAKYDQLIAWDPSGFSFHVYDQTRFAKEILPRFFKHNNMASFIRQLNMYGFRKVNSIDHGSLKNEKEDLEFHHPYFIRGKEQFLEFIKRKVPDIKPNVAAAPTAPVSSAQNPSGGGAGGQTTALVSPAGAAGQPVVQYPGIKTDDLNKVLDDVNNLKSKQKFVDDSLMDVKKENEVLWKEIATLRQKHHHQQQIVNKLIHFLVHLVNPSSLGIKRSRPLMIDSHSTSSFATVEALNGELSDAEDGGGEINEIDDEDEEEFLTAAVNNHHHLDQPPNKKAKINHHHHHHHSAVYVMPTNSTSSLNSSTMLDAAAASHKTTKFGPIHTFSPITNGGSNGLSSSLGGGGSYSTTTAANQPGGGSGVVINEIIDSPTSLLGFEPTSKDAAKGAATNGDFIDTNLFLNANPNQQPPQQQQLHQLADSNGPIITTPSSPLDDSSKSSGGLTTQLVQPTSTIQLTNDNTAHLLDGEDLTASQELAKRSMSNQQMSDHVEALQLDLASIKEFLTSNSFNQIDPYTISNLFSPLGLDSVENDSFYLEPPPLAPAPSSSMSMTAVDKLKQIGPALESILPSMLEATSATTGTGPSSTDGSTDGRLLNGNHHHHHHHHHPYHHLNHYSSYNNNGTTNNNHTWKLI